MTMALLVAFGVLVLNLLFQSAVFGAGGFRSTVLGSATKPSASSATFLVLAHIVASIAAFLVAVGLGGAGSFGGAPTSDPLLMGLGYVFVVLLLCFLSYTVGIMLGESANALAKSAKR